MMRDMDMARHRRAIGDVLRAFNAAAVADTGHGHVARHGTLGRIAALTRFSYRPKTVSFAFMRRLMYRVCQQ